MKKILFGYWLLFSSLLLAQSPDSAIIEGATDTFEIQQNTRVSDFSIGHNGTIISEKELKKYASTNLSRILQLESTLFVKDYGATGISTLSGRGGGAAHTNVLWEGFNLQSPMLGQADISLLPAIFVDNIEVQYGGESALFGNSGIGGSVHLNTKTKFNQGWRLFANISGGSFGLWNNQIKVDYSNKYYATSFRFFQKSAKNNFFLEDKNAFGSPKPIIRQTNANLNQLGLMNTHDFSIKKHHFGVKVWGLLSDRQIPPTLLQTSSEDIQTDFFIRSTANWKYIANKHVWKARTALFGESLLFKNQGIHSESKVWSSRTEVENTWYPYTNHRFNFGINYSFFRAISTGLADTPTQHRGALFISYKWTIPTANLQTVFNIREEVVDGKWTRPALSWGSSWKFYQKWYLQLHLSHNYRLPTFNDLYWDVLGNPDLVPEYSWNSELGIYLPVSIKKTKLKGSLTGFCNLVDNWILWSPNQQGLWRPENITQVWARGLEAAIQVHYVYKHWQFRWHTNYAYTQSTQIKSKESNLVGKQLIYTPVHNANLAFEIQYKRTNLLYQHSFTSSRFIDNLNTEALPFYQFANLRVSQDLSFQYFNLQFYVQVNNLYGADFQIVANRPMPWQQFEIGLQVDFNYKIPLKKALLK